LCFCAAPLPLPEALFDVDFFSSSSPSSVLSMKKEVFFFYLKGI
jgi:hypothetical protein